jgi:TetR/AcrR family transcriptional repressor of nem operon
MIGNFVEFRSELVPGGCSLMNTAVEADDGNAVLRARAKKALQSWMGRLSKITADGIRANQIDRRMDPQNYPSSLSVPLKGHS